MKRRVWDGLEGDTRILDRRGVTRAMPLEGDVGRESRLRLIGVWDESILSSLEGESVASMEVRFLEGV